MNHTQKMQLKMLIEDYANAQVAMSWQGAGDPADSAQTRLELIEAENALNDVLYLRTTNDTERLNLLLDTMLAVANDMKLPPAGQLLMDAMSGHTADGTILTGDDMKGMLDVALSTIPVNDAPMGHTQATSPVVDHAPAAPQGDWTPADERTRPCS